MDNTLLPETRLEGTCAPETKPGISPPLGSEPRSPTVVEADGVVIELVESKVYLRGHVRSFDEREEAERAAWKAPGVTAVENHVIVAPREVIG